MSTVYAQIGNKTMETGFHTTTPRASTVFNYLKQATKAGSEYFILETTSHALSQNRVHGIRFEAAVLTNITQEHAMEHKSFEEYVKVKARLLLQSKHPIINLDADIYQTVKEILTTNRKTYTSFSLKNTEANIIWNKDIKTDISDDFNRENILGAYACCVLLGIEKEKAGRALSSFTLPKGRLDIVHEDDFMVIIDFAHTPNAIFNVLQEIRKNYLKTGGRIIHVFGSASERDDVKRPMMGEASAKFADTIILTEEDHRNEDVQDICKQIAKGIGSSKPYFTEPDRAKAIEWAIQMAKKNDIVVLTGKSHEKSLARNGKEYPWDEYKAVENAVGSRK
ncbi:hypothetical protein A3H83_03610 [Candidatus Roizmanbacteria bacterium RIFCSPLOWO2_02_FULL_39_8]|nr:MAG: hypothetical protein A3H83_03610 [Candidatus Roizmanbacteria bacterium RIFCSPLOWO2_02_FULL_39_8]